MTTVQSLTAYEKEMLAKATELKNLVAIAIAKKLVEVSEYIDAMVSDVDPNNLGNWSMGQVEHNVNEIIKELDYTNGGFIPGSNLASKETLRLLFEITQCKDAGAPNIVGEMVYERILDIKRFEAVSDPDESAAIEKFADTISKAAEHLASELVGEVDGDLGYI